MARKHTTMRTMTDTLADWELAKRLGDITDLLKLHPERVVVAGLIIQHLQDDLRARGVPVEPYRDSAVAGRIGFLS